MSATITALEAAPLVRLTVGTDEICRRCPNNVDGACTTAEKTAAYDARVLALCGFAEGAVMPYSRFRGAVLERIIIPGKRADVCGDCEWDEVCNEEEALLMHSKPISNKLRQINPTSLIDRY